jgi:hypothetical protein
MQSMHRQVECPPACASPQTDLFNPHSNGKGLITRKFSDIFLASSRISDTSVPTPVFVHRVEPDRVVGGQASPPKYASYPANTPAVACHLVVSPTTFRAPNMYALPTFPRGVKGWKRALLRLSGVTIHRQTRSKLSPRGAICDG